MNVNHLLHVLPPAQVEAHCHELTVAIDSTDRQYAAARELGFLAQYECLMEIDELNLAAQYVAEQQAVNAKQDRYSELKAEFEALGSKEWFENIKPIEY